MEFPDPIVTRLAAVFDQFVPDLNERLSVEIVGVDLKRNESQCVERGRHRDGHVVGRLHGRACDVRSRTDTHVGKPIHDATADRVDDAGPVQIRRQSKGVPTTDGDSVTGFDGGDGIVEGVDAFKAVSGVQTLLGHQVDIPVMIVECPGNEENAFDVAEVALHGLDVDRSTFFGSKSAASK